MTFLFLALLSAVGIGHRLSRVRALITEQTHNTHHRLDREGPLQSNLLGRLISTVLKNFCLLPFPHSASARTRRQGPPVLSIAEGSANIK